MTVTCTKTDNLVTKRMLNIYTKFMHAEPEFCSFEKKPRFLGVYVLQTECD